jgi:hypothetical protein
MISANFFKNGVSLKLVIIALLSYYTLFFVAYVIPSPISKIITEHIPMNRVLDLQKDGFSTEEATSFFSVLGENGRSVYLRNLWSIDLIMPSLSAFSFSLLMYFITTRISFLHPRFRLLSIIPFVTAVFDYTENSIITIEVLRYPQISGIAIHIAEVCTRLKWIFISVTFYVSVLLILLLTTTMVFNYFKKGEKRV